MFKFLNPFSNGTEKSIDEKLGNAQKILKEDDFIEIDYDQLEDDTKNMSINHFENLIQSETKINLDNQIPLEEEMYFGSESFFIN